ncbi:hypothetical protein [Peterkaempfera griseoplana]|uniref:hypothetical protein n=1 Tax=Peterkaempfera griseoplana TaxID=66896 RepID=UPI000B00A737|nr:hypothetical protein [Peterkaempfera griseoplana]
MRYVASLDVPHHVVEYLSRLLAAHRRRIGTPRGSRALGPFRQAVLVLRWFRERGCVHCLARDAGVSQATGYRYLHEGIDALAAQALDLHEVLDRCRRQGMTHVFLDGILIESDRLAGVRDNGNDLWFSQKHKAFGGNVRRPTAVLTYSVRRRTGGPPVRTSRRRSPISGGGSSPWPTPAPTSSSAATCSEEWTTRRHTNVVCCRGSSPNSTDPIPRS